LKYVKVDGLWETSQRATELTTLFLLPPGVLYNI